MNIFVSFKINEKYLSTIQKNIPGVILDACNSLVKLPVGDQKKISQVHRLNKKVSNNLYYDWDLVYEYTQTELDSSSLFRVKWQNIIESCGEEGGTRYDNKKTCPICGSGRLQVGDLHLSSFKIPNNKSFYKTIGGEIIVPTIFRDIVFRNNLFGMAFLPVWVDNKLSQDFYQLKALHSIEISSTTQFGIDYFDTRNISSSEERTYNIGKYIVHIPREIYVCPNKDLVGLRLLSELHVIDKEDICGQVDFMKTAQFVGVKRGLLNPEPLYVCSKKFYDIVKKSKITGMSFEIVEKDSLQVPLKKKKS